MPIKVSDRKKRFVCSLRYPMIFRLILGFYHDFNSPNRIQNLVKFYCILFPSIMCFITLSYGVTFSFYVKVTSSIEYLSYITISLLTHDKYLFSYCRFNPVTDSFPTFLFLCKKFDKFFKLSLFLSIFLKILGFSLMIYNWPFLCNPKLVSATLALNTLWLASCLGRVVFILVFGILFCRMRTLRTILESNGFENTPHYRLTPKKYTLMYESVLNNLQKIDYPMKFLVFTFLACYVPKLVVALFQILEEMKKRQLRITTLLWFLVELSPTYVFILLTAIVLDMISEEVQLILSYTINKRLACKNEKDRAEIQEFFQYLRNNPFNYTLWRVVPLNLRTVLVVTSFAIANVIAVMQIKNTQS